jgi:FMN phosphatase YigB (HAD superfamily)
VSAPPDRILLVGDSVTDDVEAARAIGLHAVLLDRSARYTQVSPRVVDLRELLPLVRPA